MNTLLAVFIGFIVGAFAGMLLMALMYVMGRDDDGK